MQTDYVDLYVIHRFDYGTTMEETIEALELVLDAETVKYLEEPYRVKPVAAHE